MTEVTITGMSEREVLLTLASDYRDAAKRRRVECDATRDGGRHDRFRDHLTPVAAILEAAAELIPNGPADGIAPKRLGHCFCVRDWICCHCGAHAKQATGTTCPARGEAGETE